MISTRVVLAFATLALTCIAGENTALPYGCRRVSGDSFKNLGQPTPQRPGSPAHALGVICERRFHDKEQNVKCIGDAAIGISNCTMCCVCKHEDGNIDYKGTTAPANFPCGPRRKMRPQGRERRQ